MRHVTDAKTGRRGIGGHHLVKEGSAEIRKQQRREANGCQTVRCAPESQMVKTYLPPAIVMYRYTALKHDSDGRVAKHGP